MPEEFFRLPYAAAASDVIRAAAVHHHGGLYMDTDFVIVNPLEKHLELLHEWLVIWCREACIILRHRNCARQAEIL